MAVVIEHANGSISIDPTEGEDITSFAVCSDLIAQHYLDKSKRSGRLAYVCKDSRSPVIEQARAEIAAEKSLAEARKWIDRMGPKGKRRGGRETRIIR